MKIENKIFNNTDNQVNGLADETISLLKKLILLLQPLSITTTFGLRVEATAVTSSAIDTITLMSTIGGTVPTLTNINQFGNCGVGYINSSVSIIDSVPVSGGFNYSVGDIVILSGGTTGATVYISAIYDQNILTIDNIPISGGTGYISGEIVRISNGINGTIQVMAVDNSGSVVDAAIFENGYEYIIGSAQQISTTGSGSGLIINITAIKTGLGSAKYVSLLNGGSNYYVGNFSQILTNNLGFGLIISVLNINSDYGNTNFLQTDGSRWLYSDMIRNNLTF